MISVHQNMAQALSSNDIVSHNQDCSHDSKSARAVHHESNDEQLMKH
jgi:hypothetical protein